MWIQHLIFATRAYWWTWSLRWWRFRPRNKHAYMAQNTVNKNHIEQRKVSICDECQWHPVGDSHFELHENGRIDGFVFFSKLLTIYATQFHLIGQKKTFTQKLSSLWITKQTKCVYLPWDSVFWTGHVFTLIVAVFVASVVITEETVGVRRLITVVLVILWQQCIDAKGFFRWHIRLIRCHGIGKTLLVTTEIVSDETIAIAWRRHCPRWHGWWWHWVCILCNHCAWFQIIWRWFWRMHFTWPWRIWSGWHLPYVCLYLFLFLLAFIFESLYLNPKSCQIVSLRRARPLRMIHSPWVFFIMQFSNNYLSSNVY